MASNLQAYHNAWLGWGFCCAWRLFWGAVLGSDFGGCRWRAWLWRRAMPQACRRKVPRKYGAWWALVPRRACRHHRGAVGVNSPLIHARPLTYGVCLAKMLWPWKKGCASLCLVDWRPFVSFPRLHCINGGAFSGLSMASLQGSKKKNQPPSALRQAAFSMLQTRRMFLLWASFFFSPCCLGSRAR
ncbi:hypothetical protein DQ04_01411170 [Trypanosoma grayi]|uniref:hypothetical protein n=1 Tax=Trypanosoma grayi TaxID=71804 RepID=UPI0004F44A5D|nr:hypothetical protein DQ04_01411170 [Trypanosoma grayi]KEG12815.1 hypothetical protein DQ04_01411170 [Trypanosoma grayi]